MPYKTITTKRRVWICPICDTETPADSRIACSTCGKFVCKRCVGYYDVEIMKFQGNTGIRFKMNYKTKSPVKGVGVPFCPTCGKKIEQKLSQVGFSIPGFKESQ